MRSHETDRGCDSEIFPPCLSPYPHYLHSQIHFDNLKQRTLTYFITGSIPVWLTCLTGFDPAALLMFNQKQIYLFGEIQFSQTGGRLYSDNSPYKVSECSLPLGL